MANLPQIEQCDFFKCTHEIYFLQISEWCKNTCLLENAVINTLYINAE